MTIRSRVHLLVHLAGVGTGMRLFDGSESRIPLTLISCDTFESGVVDLVYGPA